jgi:hypothetical protein
MRAKYLARPGGIAAVIAQVITPMMPDTGIRYLNPGTGGFTITRPQILRT